MTGRDSAQSHAADTLRTGADECDVRAVYELCAGAASAIEWLEGQGMRFDHEGEHWAVHREAAHSCARVLHVNGDRTGVAT